MAKITITNPPPFKTNRRKCGWGASLTTCDICGRMMMGHNRGVCSRCMRSLVGDRRSSERVYCAPHGGLKASTRDMVQMARTLTFADFEKRNAKTAKATDIRRETK